MAESKSILDMSLFSVRPILLGFLCSQLLNPPAGLRADPVVAESPEETSESWSVESPPGPSSSQSIDADEGTWISLDVSPDGEEIVFDLLGDIYRMPITGADGSEGSFPVKVTEGVAWDMQPTFSPDGASIAFTSDRTGANKHGGDNIWIMGRDGSEIRQISDESFRLLNGPTWSPDGKAIVARKHFSSRRSLGAGEMWLYHIGGVAAKAQAGVQLTQRPNDQKLSILLAGYDSGQCF
jgi:hypothetical protein